MKVLGLIPARGGSKGIPNKNRKELAGKPLLQYTAEAALASKLLKKVVFSSENQELIQLAEKLGLEVPFVRPDHLSTDSAGSLEVAKHALHYFMDSGEHFDALCLLQVTTPFRTSEDIDLALRKFISEGSDSLISVREVPHQYNPHWVFTVSKNERLKIATGDSNIIRRRQDLPKAYIRDGAIYITKTEVLLEQNSFFGNSISYIENSSQHHVNIDTLEDWQKAEKIIKDF